jgi:hypothetical protein
MRVFEAIVIEVIGEPAVENASTRSARYIACTA